MYRPINLERVNSVRRCLAESTITAHRCIVQSRRVYQWSIGTPAHRESSCHPYRANRQVEIRDGSRWAKFDDLYTRCTMRPPGTKGIRGDTQVPRDSPYRFKINTAYLDDVSTQRDPKPSPSGHPYNCFLYRSQLNAAKTDRFSHRFHAFENCGPSEDGPAGDWRIEYLASVDR